MKDSVADSLRSAQRVTSLGLAGTFENGALTLNSKIDDRLMAVESGMDAQPLLGSTINASTRLATTLMAPLGTQLVGMRPGCGVSRPSSHGPLPPNPVEAPQDG